MRVAVIFILCAAIYAAVSTASFNDARAEHLRYCAQVNAGAWPNYKDMECPR